MFDEETLEFLEFLQLDSLQFEFSEFLIRYTYILIKIYEVLERKSFLVNQQLFSWTIRNVSKILHEIGDEDTEDISLDYLREYARNRFARLRLKVGEQYNEADRVFVYCYSIMELIWQYDLGPFYGPTAYRMFENSYYIDRLYHSMEQCDENTMKYLM